MNAFKILTYVCIAMGLTRGAFAGVEMTPYIESLIAEKERKMAEIEKCDSKRKGFMIAGISTLGLTAVGAVGNVALASKNKKLDAELSTEKETLKSKRSELTNLNTQITLENLKKAQEACKSPKVWTGSACVDAVIATPKNADSQCPGDKQYSEISISGKQYKCGTLEYPSGSYVYNKAALYQCKDTCWEQLALDSNINSVSSSIAECPSSISGELLYLNKVIFTGYQVPKVAAVCRVNTPIVATLKASCETTGGIFKDYYESIDTIKQCDCPSQRQLQPAGPFKCTCTELGATWDAKEQKCKKGGISKDIDAEIAAVQAEFEAAQFEITVTDKQGVVLGVPISVACNYNDGENSSRGDFSSDNGKLTLMNLPDQADCTVVALGYKPTTVKFEELKTKKTISLDIDTDKHLTANKYDILDRLNKQDDAHGVTKEEFCKHVSTGMVGQSIAGINYRNNPSGLDEVVNDGAGFGYWCKEVKANWTVTYSDEKQEWQYKCTDISPNACKTNEQSIPEYMNAAAEANDVPEMDFCKFVDNNATEVSRSKYISTAMRRDFKNKVQPEIKYITGLGYWCKQHKGTWAVSYSPIAIDWKCSALPADACYRQRVATADGNPIAQVSLIAYQEPEESEEPEEEQVVELSTFDKIQQQLESQDESVISDSVIPTQSDFCAKVKNSSVSGTVGMIDSPDYGTLVGAWCKKVNGKWLVVKNNMGFSYQCTNISTSVCKTSQPGDKPENKPRYNPNEIKKTLGAQNSQNGITKKTFCDLAFSVQGATGVLTSLDFGRDKNGFQRKLNDAAGIGYWCKELNGTWLVTDASGGGISWNCTNVQKKDCITIDWTVLNKSDNANGISQDAFCATICDDGALCAGTNILRIVNNGNEKKIAEELKTGAGYHFWCRKLKGTWAVSDIPDGKVCSCSGVAPIDCFGSKGPRYL